MSKTLDIETVQRDLIGSPYSLTPNWQNRRAIEATLEEIAGLTRRVAQERESISAVDTALSDRIRVLARAEQIHESTALEGLESSVESAYEASRLVEGDIFRHITLVNRFIDSDSKLRNVLGLAAAHAFAEQIGAVGTAHFTVDDLKSLHYLIMAGERSGGAFRPRMVSISGSPHEPPLPTDVPGATYALVEWMRTRTSSNPLIQAAVAHTWLVHIHPFEDGNGRLARLLANMILAVHDWPALIIRRGAQRVRYINALRESDAGGDVLPVIATFTEAVPRAVDDWAMTSYHLDRVEEEWFANRARVRTVWVAEVLSFMRQLSNRLDVVFPASFSEELPDRFDVARQTRKTSGESPPLADATLTAFCVGDPSDALVGAARPLRVCPSIYLVLGEPSGQPPVAEVMIEPLFAGSRAHIRLQGATATYTPAGGCEVFAELLEGSRKEPVAWLGDISSLAVRAG